MRFCISLLICFLFQRVEAEELRVRVYADVIIHQFTFTIVAGDYSLETDGMPYPNSSGVQNFLLTADGDSVLLKSNEQVLRKCKKISFTGREKTNTFQLKPLNTNGKSRSYDDNLVITVINGELRLINHVEIEHYIGGVVESEAGARSGAEYHKLQAILCRTYALGHLRRHEGEGYQLCDQVHCQVYKSKTRNSSIAGAVLATKGLVIVDADLNLITAAFHSNCGGQTLNSEDVWSLPKTYLKSVADTFCLRQPHARWQRKVSLGDWNTYLMLKEKGNLDTPPDTGFVNGMSQEKNVQRDVFYIYNGKKIPMKEIRNDWQLKSTSFKIEQTTDTLIFKGKGYGHGVGLCQEGAIEMARRGIPYKDIICFYYKDIHLVDLKALDFFRQE